MLRNALVGRSYEGIQCLCYDGIHGHTLNSLCKDLLESESQLVWCSTSQRSTRLNTATKRNGDKKWSSSESFVGGWVQLMMHSWQVHTQQAETCSNWFRNVNREVCCELNRCCSCICRIDCANCTKVGLCPNLVPAIFLDRGLWARLLVVTSDGTPFLLSFAWWNKCSAQREQSVSCIKLSFDGKRSSPYSKEHGMSFYQLKRSREVLFMVANRPGMVEHSHFMLITITIYCPL